MCLVAFPLCQGQATHPEGTGGLPPTPRNAVSYKSRLRLMFAQGVTEDQTESSNDGIYITLQPSSDSTRGLAPGSHLYRTEGKRRGLRRRVM